MLDFTPVRSKEMTMAELTSGLGPGDLRQITNEMIDTILSLIEGCTNEDVIFEPVDPDANDTFASNDEDVDLAWTLGHVIVHVTASSEESAALASELARGVPHRGGRSRSEVPWETVTTIEQCRHRLEESRRMRLVSLDMWPDKPDLENSYRRGDNGPNMNAVTQFVSGLSHADSHLAQIKDIVAQAKTARS